jgi:hypothetical protein
MVARRIAIAWFVSAFLATSVAPVLAQQQQKPDVTAIARGPEGEAARRHAQRFYRQHLPTIPFGSRPPHTSAHYLGPGFFPHLKRLGKAGVWIDAGPGEHADVALAYLLDAPDLAQFDLGGEKAKVIAIGLEKPSRMYHRALKAVKARGFHLEFRGERFIEDYQPGEIEPADILSDQFGPFTYTDAPHRVLEAEGRLLKPGGVLYTHKGPRTIIIDQDLREVTLPWLASIEGLSLQGQPTLWHDHSLTGLTMARTGDVVRAPPLTLLDFADERHPPQRVFLWESAPRGPVH